MVGGGAPVRRQRRARREATSPSSRSTRASHCARKAPSAPPRCPACRSNAGPIPALSASPPSSACATPTTTVQDRKKSRLGRIAPHNLRRASYSQFWEDYITDSREIAKVDQYYFNSHNGG